MVSGGEEFVVEAILDKKGSGARAKYLISWKGYPEEENTWESAKNLKEDGLEASIDAYEAAESAEVPEKVAKTPKRGRAKSPAAKKSATKKSPARKKSPAPKKSPARKKSPAPKKSPARKKSPAPKKKSPKKADEVDEINDEDVAAAVAAVENLADQIEAEVKAATDEADADASSSAGVSYAQIQIPASLAWLGGFLLSVLGAVILRLTNDGSNPALAYLQLALELVPPGLCVMAVWNSESDDYSDKVGAVLPWMVALPTLENLRRILEASAGESLATAFLLALVFLFAVMSSIHKNALTPTAAFALPVLATAGTVKYLEDHVPVVEPGLDMVLMLVALFLGWMALFRSIFHLAEAPNPMATSALSRWVGLTAVLLSFTMLIFALLGSLGKLSLDGPVSVVGELVSETKEVVGVRQQEIEGTNILTYYSLRWLASLLFVVSVKADQMAQ